MCVPWHGVGHWLGAPGTSWMGSGRCWDSTLGDSVSRTSPQPRVHLHVQTDHPTACTHPELPQDTHCPYTHCQLTPARLCTHTCVPTQPSAIPHSPCAQLPHCTPCSCSSGHPTPVYATPVYPTVCSLFPCSLTHSHICLLTEPGAPLSQPPLRHGPGAAGHWGDPDFWAGRTLGRATGSALVTEGPQWSVVSPVCSK